MGADFMEPNILLVVNRFLFYSHVASTMMVSTEDAFKYYDDSVALQPAIYIDNLYKMHLAMPYDHIHTWNPIGINSVELSVKTNK